MKQVYRICNGLVCGFSSEMRCVTGDLFQISQRSISVWTAELLFSQHLAEIRCFFSEPCILLENAVMAFWHMIQLVYQVVVLSSKTNHMGPKLIQVPLFPHPGPPSRFPVGNHSPLLPFINDSELLFLSFIRSWVIAETWRLWSHELVALLRDKGIWKVGQKPVEVKVWLYVSLHHTEICGKLSGVFRGKVVLDSSDITWNHGSNIKNDPWSFCVGENGRAA